MEKLQSADRALLEVRQEGQAAVDQLQVVLNEERATWDTERSTLATRLEQVIMSRRVCVNYKVTLQLTHVVQFSCV